MSISSVAYFGEEGSFSHLVALRRFASREKRKVASPPLISCPTVEECFSDLILGKYSQVVVPIENTSSGMIAPTVDQLIFLAKKQNPHLVIREALTLRIELALLVSSPGAEVRKIYSHPAPFVHVRSWLDDHYPQAQRISVHSTSEAAQRVQKESHAAAIAGIHTAELYQLHPLHHPIGSERANQTTFFVVGRPLPSRAKPTRTTLVFELEHQPGSLVHVLHALARQQLNLTKIESRPIPGRLSEYRFMIEFEGVPSQESFQKALKRIEKIAPFAAVLGSYPLRRI